MNPIIVACQLLFMSEFIRTTQMKKSDKHQSHFIMMNSNNNNNNSQSNGEEVWYSNFLLDNNDECYSMTFMQGLNNFNMPHFSAIDTSFLLSSPNSADVDLAKMLGEDFFTSSPPQSSHMKISNPEAFFPDLNSFILPNNDVNTCINMDTPGFFEILPSDAPTMLPLTSSPPKSSHVSANLRPHVDSNLPKMHQVSSNLSLPSSLIMTCKPEFTLNTHHKPRGACYSTYVNDEITIHVPISNQQVKQTLSSCHVELRGYLGNAQEESNVTNTAGLEDVSVVEFRENIKFDHKSDCMEIRIPFKRDNTSKRGKRREKISSQQTQNKKKGETAPKKIDFILLVDSNTNEILYRSDMFWARSKTRKEMDAKREKHPSSKNTATKRSHGSDTDSNGPPSDSSESKKTKRK